MVTVAKNVGFWTIAMLVLASCSERDEPAELARIDGQQSESWDDDLDTREPGEEITVDSPTDEPVTDADLDDSAVPTGGLAGASAPVGAAGGRTVGRASPSSSSSSSSSTSSSPSSSAGARVPLRPAASGSAALPSGSAPSSSDASDSQPELGEQSDLNNSADEDTVVDGADSGEVAVPESTDDSVSRVRYSDGWEVVYDEPPEPVAVVDDLADPEDWWLFEQVIPFRPECYQLDLAEASVVELDGQPVLSLTANAGGSSASNHALLGRFITSTPVALGKQRLAVEAQLAPESAGQTQTGPEISVQISARMADGTYRTTVFGLQFVAASNTWQVLTGGDEKDAWTQIATAPIAAKSWYRIEFTFDTSTNRYERLLVTGPDGFEIDEPIVGLGTGWEDKGATGPASWVTLDAENLFTCDEPRSTTATVYYRSLSLNTEGS